MLVEKSETNSENADDFVCLIKLTKREVQGVLTSLARTMCNGDDLTISMELEDKLFETIK